MMTRLNYTNGSGGARTRAAIAVTYSSRDDQSPPCRRVPPTLVA